MDVLPSARSGRGCGELPGSVLRRRHRRARRGRPPSAGRVRDAPVSRSVDNEHAVPWLRLAILASTRLAGLDPWPMRCLALGLYAATAWAATWPRGWPRARARAGSPAWSTPPAPPSRVPVVERDHRSLRDGCVRPGVRGAGGARRRAWNLVRGGLARPGRGRPQRRRDRRAIPGSAGLGGASQSPAGQGVGGSRGRRSADRRGALELLALHRCGPVRLRRARPPARPRVDRHGAGAAGVGLATASVARPRPRRRPRNRRMVGHRGHLACAHAARATGVGPALGRAVRAVRARRPGPGPRAPASPCS